MYEGKDSLRARRRSADVACGGRGHDDVADQAHVARYVLSGDRDGGRDAGLPRQCRLDLAELDPEATDLDLLVAASEVLDPSRRSR